jgi:formate dehydrogenase iron-sulfur subunit
VKACPTGCLHFGSKDDMLDLGNKRVAQLVANGQQQAVLYDPPGVGGTSVVTVLAHGDHPEWYGLPRDPHVPRAVKLWKGVLKPLGMAVIGLSIFGAFAHYVTYGRKQPDPQDDARKEGS